MTFTWDLKEFFIANRYNLLHHLSQLLGGVAYVFAWISLHTVELLPGLSEACELRAIEFSDWSKGVYRYALKLTMAYTWAKLVKENEKDN